MSLVHPYWLAAALVSLVLFVFLRRRVNEDDWRRVLSREVHAALTAGVERVGRRDLTFLLLALVFLALSSPSIRAPAQAWQPDQALMAVVDLSRSMTLADAGPSRLTAARAAAADIGRFAGARPAGLIVFAGDAYLAQPFSTNRAQYASLVAALDHGLVAEPGSDPSRALTLAATVLRQSGVATARLVLISDGGGFGPASVDVARLLAGRGVTVDGVMVAPAGTGSPDAPDPAAFAATVEAGGGRLVTVDANGNPDLGALDLQRTGGQRLSMLPLELATTDWHNLSHWLLIAGAPLFLLLFRRTG
jgi:Ca-activated chloride channel homolog